MTTGGAEQLFEAGAGPVAAPETAAEIAARSPLQLFWGRIRTDKVALGSALFIVFLILVAIFAPQIVSVTGAHPPNEQSTKYLDDFGSAAPPSFENHLYFGTDGLGRDVFSRTVYGARVSLAVAFIATFLSVLIGVVFGTLAGFYRGTWDTVLSRIMDVMLAFPVFLLALGLGAACAFGDGCKIPGKTAGSLMAGIGLLMTVALSIGLLFTRRGGTNVTRVDARARLALPVAAIFLGLVVMFVFNHSAILKITPGLPVVIFVIVLPSWPYMARIIRGQTLSLRETEFVVAARSMGASDGRIMIRHVLPNLIAPIIVYTTLLVPTVILFEAALSFLGVGVQPPTSSWGAMISDATEIFDTAWWYMTFPGLALVLTVLAFNLIGDGLQDALNPKTSGR
jgi:ABC-type dipeptide/oligopeptide/nickel transport system permease subunit